MQRITPCLWFDHQAEEAAKFYTSLFPNSRIHATTHYSEDVAKAANRDAGSVMTVTFALNGMNFMMLNGGPMYQFSPSVSLFVDCASASDVDVLWDKLSDGGSVLMPIDSYPWSERYGWLTDQFGVSWQLFLSGEGRQGIAPMLMFVGDRHGKAEEAMRFYLSQFANSRVRFLARYEEGDEGVVGTIKHGRFLLDGQEFMVMDASGPHPFSFEQAISFVVNCKDQSEIDRFWDGLSADGGTTSVCGWLGDKYGVPWQIVPTRLSELLASRDRDKAKRVTTALLQMTKLDIAQLEGA